MLFKDIKVGMKLKCKSLGGIYTEIKIGDIFIVTEKKENGYFDIKREDGKLKGITKLSASCWEQVNISLKELLE